MSVWESLRLFYQSIYFVTRVGKKINIKIILFLFLLRILHQYFIFILIFILFLFELLLMAFLKPQLLLFELQTELHVSWGGGGGGLQLCEFQSAVACYRRARILGPGDFDARLAFYFQVKFLHFSCFSADGEYFY